MQYDITTAPTVEWITVTDARLWLRRSSADDDVTIATLIKEVREGLEHEIERSLLSQTITLWLDSSETSGPVWLPMPPALAITSVTGYDEEGNASVVSSSNYRLTSLDPGRLHEVDGTVGWSSAVDRTYDGLKIIYTAGYGTASTDLPGAILLTLRRRLARAFVYRGLPVTGTVVSEVSLPDVLDDYRYTLSI